MPPRQKTEVKPELAEAMAAPIEKDPYGIYLGDFVHVNTVGGAKHKSAEVLSFNVTGMTIRTNANGPTMAEVSFIPWSAIDGVGIIGKR